MGRLLTFSSQQKDFATFLDSFGKALTDSSISQLTSRNLIRQECLRLGSQSVKLSGSLLEIYQQLKQARIAFSQLLSTYLQNISIQFEGQLRILEEILPVKAVRAVRSMEAIHSSMSRVLLALLNSRQPVRSKNRVPRTLIILGKEGDIRPQARRSLSFKQEEMLFLKSEETYRFEKSVLMEESESSDVQIELDPISPDCNYTQ